MLVALLWGCSAPAPTYWADVKPILDGRCNSCHQDGGIAPFRLDRFEDVEAVGELVVNAVETGSMPPWGATGDLAFARNPSLSTGDVGMLRDWLEAGMPEGDPASEGSPLDPVAVSLPRVDVTLAMAEPYSPPADAVDDYRCFLVDWTEPDTRFVTGFDVKPDNGSVVHHVAAFLVRPDGLAGPGVIDTFRDFDDAEPGPGYRCFGGPSGAEDTQVPIQQVAQWVPGNGAFLFPDGVGIAVPEGSLLVLQLHYNTATWDGEPDQSSVDLIVEDEVERLGAFAPYLDPLWPLGNMTIGAGATATHDQEGDPRPFFELLNDELDLSEGFDIHASMLHMHTLGRTGVVGVQRASGERIELLRVDDWDFDWQLTYAFEDPIGFEPGDTMFLSCRFDNPGDEPVNWGEGSDEEMCVGNLFISMR